MEGFIESGGYKVHHVTWGEDGPRVLLIHSMGMDGHSMDALAESLKDEYRVLSLTILDHGDSDPPRGDISLPEHAEVMRGCYNQLGFKPSVLIGHSIGGMMGMILTADHPDEFLGLVLVDIAPFESTGRSPHPQPPESFKDEKQARAWLKERYPGFTEYYYDNRIKHAFKREGSTLRLKPRGDRIRGGLATDLWPYVKRIKTPTLLLAGKESTLVTPKTRRRMESTVPGLETVVVGGTGHMIPQDKPEEFERLVRSFLKRVN
ncbi:alpha/beta hydrolase [Candidatus Bathyarchaeota archaeon]|nr:alpha/beta hydrolase [Candidatus Bathyarchaeota archaeon]